MDGLRRRTTNGWRPRIGLLLSLVLLGSVGCRSKEQASIAVIPRTSGTILWEPENVGAQRAAAALGERIDWNASTREGDIDGQIALVDTIRKGRYRGLVLAPDHSQALITPVRRALASGLPIVIVGSRAAAGDPGECGQPGGAADALRTLATGRSKPETDLGAGMSHSFMRRRRWLLPRGLFCSPPRRGSRRSMGVAGFAIFLIVIRCAGQGRRVEGLRGNLGACGWLHAHGARDA